MPHDRLDPLLRGALGRLAAEGRRKAPEAVIVGILPPGGGRGPRALLDGEGKTPFLRMNANNYLGLSTHPDVVEAEHRAVGRYGAGPGAVRFISGTWAPHRDLERRLAAFHKRQAGMIFSSAYGAMMGILPSLITADTAVISDELNHNCIINAVRLARPRERYVYRHLDLQELRTQLRRASATCRRAVIVTDGIFSMRGDHAPLQEIMDIARGYDAAFPENALVVVDDSHGVGAFGLTGRGTEEHAGAAADVLIATLGKAFGVNGGYVVGSDALIDYLRELSALYVYSNPISPGEAAAASAALSVLDGPAGLALLQHLRQMTGRFRAGLARLNFATVPGDHPIVPLVVGDTARTAALVQHLRRHGVLATGLAFPVVPRGAEEIRFQICADHTPADIDEVLGVLEAFAGPG